MQWKKRFQCMPKTIISVPTTVEILDFLGKGAATPDIQKTETSA